MKLQLVGQVDDEMVRQVDEFLTEAEKSKIKTVEFMLCSEGGHAMSGLAIYDRMRQSSCKIVAKAYGNVNSAATIILVGADRRLMSENCWFMVHDTSTKVRGDTSTIVRAGKQAEREEQQWANILSKHSTLDYRGWRESSSNTTFFTANECLMLGIIHAIIPNKGKK